MESSLKPLAILVNPSSGGGRAEKLLPAVEEQLDLMRMPFRVEVTRSAEHAVNEALIAAEAGEIPVVMSGDGLVGIVGGVLAGSDTPLGVIPGGRGNDLARVLGIPDDPAEAAEVAALGHTRRIDVGEANGVRFLCIASCGFDSDANRIANESRLFRGRAVYAYAALRALIAWKPAKFRLRSRGQQFNFTGYSVAVANSQAYGGGMFVAPAAKLDDGQFDIVIVSEVGKWRFLINLPKVFKGEHIANDEVKVFRASQLDLDASRPFRLYADGEHITDLPAKLRVLPSALKVIVPGDTA